MTPHSQLGSHPASRTASRIIMSSGRSYLGAYVPLLSQMALAAVALVGLTFAPPARGKVLLIPLTIGARAKLPVEIFRHEALLLGVGPLPGSLVVMEEHQALAMPMLRLGVLALASPPAGCGEFLHPTSAA